MHENYIKIPLPLFKERETVEKLRLLTAEKIKMKSLPS